MEYGSDKWGSDKPEGSDMMGSDMGSGKYFKNCFGDPFLINNKASTWHPFLFFRYGWMV